MDWKYANFSTDTLLSWTTFRKKSSLNKSSNGSRALNDFYKIYEGARAVVINCEVQLRTILQNKEIPVDERWSLFISRSLLREVAFDSTYCLPAEFGDPEEAFEWITTLPINRDFYQTYPVEYLISDMEGKIGEEFDGVPVTFEMVHRCMEYIMSRGLYFLKY